MTQLNELKRMQQLAGLITESQDKYQKRLFNEGFIDNIQNAAKVAGAKMAGGNPAILQKAITDSGIKLNTPIYGTATVKGVNRVPCSITFKSIDYKTAKIIAVVNHLENGKWVSDQETNDKETQFIEDDLVKIVAATTPEDAQTAADRFVSDVKGYFESGVLSYKVPEPAAAAAAAPQKESIEQAVNEALRSYRKKK